jgi:hypothetical protein
MDPLAILILFPGALAMALALPPAVIGKSGKRFFLGLFPSFFAILLPLTFFFLSSLLTPDSKHVCKHGWIDCFAIGKLALTPLVLWASAALYAIEICQVADRTRPWIVRGIFLGATISPVCLVFGFVTYGIEDRLWVPLLVPFYTSIWYISRSLQAIKSEKPKSTTLVTVLIGSLPFWAVSIFWSCVNYRLLPEQSPDCFVVTAASRGHRKFVGPFIEVPHRGQMRTANRQLATLWQFEEIWRSWDSRSHAVFRRGYNIVGPVIAKRIASPLLAGAVYVVLKPVEFLARLLIKIAAICHHSFQTGR